MTKYLDRLRDSSLKRQHQLEKAAEHLNSKRRRTEHHALNNTYSGLFSSVLNYRKWGQRSRRFVERMERNMALDRLLPVPTAAHLVNAMQWHTHSYFILIVATHPAVTSRELRDVYGFDHSNPRMIARRLAPDLARLGWQIVCAPLAYQNQPWGWWLIKLDDE